MRAIPKLLSAVAVSLLASACGSSTTNTDLGGASDLSAPFDMQQPTCVSTPPMRSVDFLNACTTAQPGDPAKDYPYFPSLAPGGVLPPLP